MHPMESLNIVYFVVVEFYVPFPLQWEGIKNIIMIVILYNYVIKK